MLLGRRNECYVATKHHKHHVRPKSVYHSVESILGTRENLQFNGFIPDYLIIILVMLLWSLVYINIYWGNYLEIIGFYTESFNPYSGWKITIKTIVPPLQKNMEIVYRHLAIY